MSDPVDGIDAHDCGEIYDTAGALMAIATHSPAGGLAGLGTHFLGNYFCNGGTALQAGPPPDYFGGKLGYDPAHDAAPAFVTPDLPADSPYLDMGSNTGGFDYDAADDHVSVDGFDYAANDSHDSTDGASSGDSSSSSSSSDSI